MTDDHDLNIYFRVMYNFVCSGLLIRMRQFLLVVVVCCYCCFCAGVARRALGTIALESRFLVSVCDTNNSFSMPIVIHILLSLSIHFWLNL
jgi:hypothetical protein